MNLQSTLADKELEIQGLEQRLLLANQCCEAQVKNFNTCQALARSRGPELPSGEMTTITESSEMRYSNRYKQKHMKLTRVNANFILCHSRLVEYPTESDATPFNMARRWSGEEVSV